MSSGAPRELLAAPASLWLYWVSWYPRNSRRDAGATKQSGSPLRAGRSRGGFLVARGNQQKNALDCGIIKNLFEGGIGLGLGNVLVAFVERLAQIVGAMFGVSDLGVFLRHHEEEQPVVFHRAILHHGADALIVLERVRIDFQRLVKFGGRLGIFFGLVVRVTEIRVRAALARVDRDGLLIFADGATIVFLLVIDHSEVIHGAGIFLVGFGGALEIFFRLAIVGHVQISDADHVDENRIFRLAFQKTFIGANSGVIPFFRHHDFCALDLHVSPTERGANFRGGW